MSEKRPADGTPPTAVVVGVGAERGLGAALCRRFAAAGHHVFVGGRTAAKLDTVVKQIEADIKGTFFSPDTKAHGLGWMTKDAWSKTTQILLSQGAMPKAIDVDSAFNDKFLSGANALKQ